eukprot:gnl/Spiro4/14652_TR7894_c0_g1_i1.p1 gnl/Spiro4/14652_TR7894_c0_g1~~gnl/Spiro4/14652_TR7894_c0_g1_i1.p1  ORF type:complete len:210 (+),score=52.10 gnl/Spiro4/14652_TR7894_c0_g1_i1:40-630(+)
MSWSFVSSWSLPAKIATAAAAAGCLYMFWPSCEDEYKISSVAYVDQAPAPAAEQSQPKPQTFIITRSGHYTRTGWRSYAYSLLRSTLLTTNLFAGACKAFLLRFDEEKISYFLFNATGGLSALGTRIFGVVQMAATLHAHLDSPTTTPLWLLVGLLWPNIMMSDQHVCVLVPPALNCFGLALMASLGSDQYLKIKA